MEKNASFLCIAAGSLLVIFGCVIAIADPVVGIPMTLVGIVAMVVPFLGSRAPRIDFDGETLRIRGVLTDKRIAVSDIDKIYSVESIQPVVMVVGYGGSRYYGGSFVAKGLGNVHAAVDSEIPLCIVLETKGDRYVFNTRDYTDTKLLLMRLEAASSGNEEE